MKPMLNEHPARDHWTWEAGGTGVEAWLFASVQAVMVVCIVLVAAQLFATA